MSDFHTSADSLIEDPLHVAIHFSLDAFMILFVVVFESLVSTCLSVGLFEFILPGVVELFRFYTHVFHKIWEDFSHYF